MNKILLGLVAYLVVGSTQASILSEDERNTYTISHYEISEINLPNPNAELDHGRPFDHREKLLTTVVDPGLVIGYAKDLVALGQSVYDLVQKGKPSNTTTYAPISIVPKVNGQPADVFDLENFKVPVKRAYQVNYYNVYNANVVHFKFSIMYSYGGTFNGSGAYLTATQIIPEEVKTLWGYDFSATMKLGGMQNTGTKANPIAGVVLNLHYNINTVVKAETKVLAFFIGGNGFFKFYK
jgi:hypothetical protein